MSLVYATPDDLTAGGWIAAVPATAGRLLAAGSRRVRNATRAAVYATDTTGAATDPAVVEALRDATCAQVAAWIIAGIDPAAGTVQIEKAPIAAKTLGSRSVTYDTAAAASVTAMQARAAAATQLAPEAAAILADAGLLGGPVWSPR